MHGKPYVYVYFMPQNDYDALIPLHVTPKPATTICVYMLWKQLDGLLLSHQRSFMRLRAMDSRSSNGAATGASCNDGTRA